MIEPLLRAVTDEGYSEPTPIQAQAIPHVLAGKDLLGLAQTGTGKTAAFALPILQRLAATPRPSGPRPVRALIITPTRELASQIGESFETYGRHLDMKVITVFGGVGSRPQEDALRRGVDILIATPGRLLDHMHQRVARFDRLEVFVLDEADRMLDMGFAPDVRRIIAALPKVRQNLFFSATMPTEAQRLAQTILHDPAKVSVQPPATTAEKVEQVVYHVDKAKKLELLVDLLADAELSRVLVFARTKRGADRLVVHLSRYGTKAAVIHGDRSQGARERALADFKAGKARVLVATDIAARGIDVEDVTHVLNFDLPNLPESYVHRIGRTARAGATGKAISFCTSDEREYLADIEKTIRMRIPTMGHVPPAVAAQAEAKAAPQARRPAPRASHGAPKSAQHAARKPAAAASAQPAQHAPRAPARPAQHAAPKAAGSTAASGTIRRLPGETLSGDRS
ncbi:MAG: DEAD/DEAH box helicase [Myxococcota bacterium]